MLNCGGFAFTETDHPMSSELPSLDIEQARLNMVEQQIRTWEVLDQSVLDLLLLVRRELFVPPAFRLLAFTDMEIPLRIDGVDTGECMFAPKVEAWVPGMKTAASFSVVSIAPIGSPLANALARVMISGTTPSCWWANRLPVLPMPVCTSSKISSSPCLSQSERIACR